MAKFAKRESPFSGLMSEENVPTPKRPTTPTPPPQQPAKRPIKQVRVQHMMTPAMIAALDEYCEKYETTRSTVIRNAVRDWFEKNGIEF